MRACQLLFQLSLVNRLNIRVATNVLLGDKDVGHGTLVSHLLKSILDVGAII